MNKVKLFNQDKVYLSKFLKGHIISEIKYCENAPIEFDSIEINFADNSYFVVYALTRIIFNEEIVLTSCDYNIDKNLVEENSEKSIENKSIYNALIKANSILKGKAIDKTTINGFGDLVLGIGTNIRIEIFFDTSELDADYYSYYGNNNTSFSLFKENNNLYFVERSK